MDLKLDQRDYARYVAEKMPKSPLGKDLLLAYLTGGALCCVGQALTELFTALGAGAEAAPAWTCVALIFLGVLLTALGVYDRIARFAGAGTLVPITGFANAVASPALEFKTEGYITGTAVKMFTIAGPVIVYGTLASVAYGVILMLTH